MTENALHELEAKCNGGGGIRNDIGRSAPLGCRRHVPTNDAVLPPPPPPPPPPPSTAGFHPYRPRPRPPPHRHVTSSRRHVTLSRCYVVTPPGPGDQCVCVFRCRSCRVSTRSVSTVCAATCLQRVSPSRVPAASVSRFCHRPG